MKNTADATIRFRQEFKMRPYSLKCDLFTRARSITYASMSCTTTHSGRTYLEACFPPGEFVRANREKSNLIGWRGTNDITTQSHSLFVCAREKIAKWKTGFWAGERTERIKDRIKEIHLCAQHNDITHANFLQNYLSRKYFLSLASYFYVILALVTIVWFP
jgi:hypothetical protein